MRKPASGTPLYFFGHRIRKSDVVDRKFEVGRQCAQREKNGNFRFPSRAELRLLWLAPAPQTPRAIQSSGLNRSKGCRVSRISVLIRTASDQTF